MDAGLVRMNLAPNRVGWTGIVTNK